MLATRRDAMQVAATAFVVLFCIVGLALWGLPFYYDFMVQQFGWTRAQVTSGNALSKLVVGPIFGFIAGWIIDRFGPRRVMMAGILMAGGALVGLGWVSTLGMFYLFYFFNALGYVCGGPLPNQVLLSRWFDKSRGKAMGFAYLGIGIGGATVPWISHALVQHFGWQAALRLLGLLIIVVSFPLAFLVKEAPPQTTTDRNLTGPADVTGAFKTLAFYLLTLGSMCSIAAVSGTQQNLKLFLSLDRHFAQSDAARVLSLVLSFSIVGRLLMGWLADRFSKKYVMLLTYLLVAAGIPFLFLGQTRARSLRFGRGVWSRTGRRLHDHSVDDRGNLWDARSGKIAGSNPDRGRHCRSCLAVVDGPLTGCDRKLFRKLLSIGRRGVAGSGRGVGFAGAEEGGMSAQPILRVGNPEERRRISGASAFAAIGHPVRWRVVERGTIAAALAAGERRNQDRQPNRRASHGRLGRYWPTAIRARTRFGAGSASAAAARN